MVAVRIFILGIDEIQLYMFDSSYALHTDVLNIELLGGERGRGGRGGGAGTGDSHCFKCGEEVKLRIIRLDLNWGFSQKSESVASCHIVF